MDIRKAVPEIGSPLPRPALASHKLQRAVAAIALIALLVDSLTVRSLILLAPYIRSQLGIDESQYGYLMAALMTGTMLTTLPLGGLMGRINTRRGFGAILTLIGIGLLTISFQASFYGLVLALFFTGVLRAGIIPLVNRVIAESYDRNQRGAITGFIFAAIPMGGFLGALALPALGGYFDWGMGYRLLGIFGLAGGLTAWVLLPRDQNAYPANRPKIDLRSLTSKSFIILGLGYGLFALSMTTEAFITLYLVDMVKISALVAGVFFGMIQLTGVAGRLFWGVLADRYFSHNRWWLLAFTSSLMVISFLLLVRLGSQSPYWLIGLDMLGFGLSAASSWVILSTLVGDVVGISAVAAATAVIFFITNITDTGGPVLFSKALGLTQSYQSTLTIFMFINLAAVLIFTWMALRNPSPVNSGA
jgi:predicted MFS family arabinose efflux permease